jgi:hypothetical protein
VESQSRHRNHHKRERHNSPRHAALSLAEAILNEEARRPGAGLRRLRTTSLTISASGMPMLPDSVGSDDLGRARARHCAPKKKGAGRAGWGSIKDEIRLAQTESGTEAIPAAASASSASSGQRQRRRTRSLQSANDSDNISDAGDHDSGDEKQSSSLQDSDIVFSVVMPECSAQDVVQTMRPVLEDYLEHGQVPEVLHACRQLNMGKHVVELVREALQQGLERKVRRGKKGKGEGDRTNRTCCRASRPTRCPLTCASSPPSNPRPAPQDDARELISTLLVALLEDGVIAELDICDAFDALFGVMHDILLDVPEAPAILGKFIARAVTDDCIGGDYVTLHDAPDNSHAIAALGKAAALLSIPNTRAHMDHVRVGEEWML